jgi:hypothetical protein
MEQSWVNDGLHVSSFGTQVMASWRDTAHGDISVCVNKPDLELQYFSRKSLRRHQTNNI